MPTALIPVHEPDAWNAVLDKCRFQDIYHSPGYHSLASELGEGEPYLFSFSLDGEIAALPFLLRTLNGIDGIGPTDWTDATSVYGYPGPVTSMHEGNPTSGAFSKAFQKALLETLHDMRCISLFSRLNPLSPDTWLLSDAAEVDSSGITVAVDLTAPESVQLGEMSKGHRYDIRKAIREGVVVSEDESFQRIDEFVGIYYETMDRSNAGSYYYFPERYFQLAKSLLGKSVHLYFAETGDKTVAGSLFFECNGILQYHLSATPTEYLNYSGAKVIIDNVRRLGASEGKRWLHLGGGVSSKEADPLFRFKAGFSRKRLPFHVVRLISDRSAYDKAVEARNNAIAVTGRTAKPGSYFPAYRAQVNG